MSFRQEFNDQEWAALQYSFLWVFQAVAGADNNIDKKEKAAFEYVVSNPDKIPCELAVEVLKSMQEEGNSIFEMSKEDLRDTKDGLNYTTELLESKMERNEIISYKKALMAFGVVIGKASGSWFADNFSDEEFRELKRVSGYLDIKLQQMMNSGALTGYFDAMREIK